MEAESLLVREILQQLDNRLKMASLCWVRWLLILTAKGNDLLLHSGARRTRLGTTGLPRYLLAFS